MTTPSRTIEKGFDGVYHPSDRNLRARTNYSSLALRCLMTLLGTRGNSLKSIAPLALHMNFSLIRVPRL